MIARCEPECFHRAIYYIKNLSHKQGHNRKENVIVSTEKIRKTGGNNTPLVESGADCICIAGNIIDRQPENGGNGMGWQKGLSYTLTATDRHALFARQRVDAFRADYIASTESARQHKDATDLVMNVMQKLKQPIQLIRRLIPLECERLQGFPDGWTNVPDASDSPRYKALGNSVAVPCVMFLMQGIRYAVDHPEKRP